jgi:hypothetical protein
MAMSSNPCGILLALLCLGTAMVPAADPEYLVPRLEVPEIPVQAEHLPLEVVVRVHNPLAVPYEIEDVIAGCACTTTHLTVPVIPVGGSVPLHLKVDHTDRSGPTEIEVYIVSSKADQPPLQVRFAYAVLGDVTIDQVVDVPGDGAPVPRPSEADQRNVRTFLIDPSWGRVDHPRFIARIGSDQPPVGGLQIAIQEVPEPWSAVAVPQSDGSHVVILTLKPGTAVPKAPPRKRLTQVVRLGTNHPRKPTLALEIVINPLGGVPFFTPK